jgi:hypothetical protein
MKTFNLIAIILFLFLESCGENNNIIIRNNSLRLIDSITVVGNPSCPALKTVNIKKDTIIYTNLVNCRNRKQYGDGSYQIKLYSDGKMHKQNVGYFTNGFVYFDEMEIIIDKNNTIITTFN